jgi:hypothetical protein
VIALEEAIVEVVQVHLLLPLLYEEYPSPLFYPFEVAFYLFNARLSLPGNQFDI